MHEDQWSVLQRQIIASSEFYRKSTQCPLLVYVLYRFSIDILVEESDVSLHVKRTYRSEKMFGPEIVVLSNGKVRELAAHANSEQGFVLETGEILNTQEFCNRLFDLACNLSRRLA